MVQANVNKQGSHVQRKEKNNVKFHALVMEKMRATVYIDDKNYDRRKKVINESFTI